MRLLIAGGGTGGHLYPGVAVSRELLRRHPQSEVLFVGSPKELDSDLVLKEGYAFQPVHQKPFPSSFFPFKGLEFTLNSITSLLKSIPQVKRFHPDIVLGMGGFSSVPTVLAARLLGVPSVLFEPNQFPGKANRFLAPFAKKIAVGFQLDKAFFKPEKVVQTGIPVRETIERESAGKTFSSNGAFTLLVMGGSRGAAALNKAVLEVFPKLKTLYPQLKIIHLTGKEAFEWVREGYSRCGDGKDVEIYPFKKEIHELFGRADAVLGRSGASSLAEFAVMGLPALLVPYPYSTQDHQVLNARHFEKAGAAKMVLEKDFTPDGLIACVKEWIELPEERKKMGAASKTLAFENASQHLLDLLETCAKKKN